MTNQKPPPFAVSYSHFVEKGPEYLSFNRLINAVELSRILEAGDGGAFDEHYEDMLAATTEKNYGVEAEPLARIETRRGHHKIQYRPSSSRIFTHTFSAFVQMRSAFSQGSFVEALLGPSGVRFPVGQCDAIALEAEGDHMRGLRERFAGEHLVSLPPFLAPKLMGEIAQQVQRLPFRKLLHTYIGPDYTMDFAPLQALLHFLVMDHRVVSMVESLIGVPEGTLMHFSGRIYQMIPRRDSDSWHNDIHMQDRRLVALSLGLQTSPSQGGELLLREKSRLRYFGAGQPLELGALTIFRISRALQHKVARIQGGARTNLAGWYCAGSEYDFDGWIDQGLTVPEPCSWWSYLKGW